MTALHVTCTYIPEYYAVYNVAIGRPNFDTFVKRPGSEPCPTIVIASHNQASYPGLMSILKSV